MSAAELDISQTTPELSLSPQEVADSLVTSYKIAQEVAKIRDDRLSTIRKQMEWVDITPKLNGILQQARWSDSIRERRALYSRAAAIQVELGDIDQAENSITLAEHFGERAYLSAYIAIAKARVQQGEDHSRAFARSLEVVDGYEDITWEDNDPVARYAEVARAYHEVRVDPEPLFTRLTTIVEANGRAWHDYSRFAEQLIKLNYLDRARELIGTLEQTEQNDESIDSRSREDLRISIRSKYRSISEKLLSHGDIAGAVTNAKKTEDREFLAHIYSEGAKRNALNAEGGDALHLANEALTMVKDIPYTTSRVRLWATIATVYSLFRFPSEPLYEEAVREALEGDDVSDKVDRLLIIASIRQGVELDGTHYLNAALEQVEQVPLIDLEDEDIKERIEATGEEIHPYEDRDRARERVIDMFINCGDIDRARDEAKKIESHDGVRAVERNILLSQAETALKPKDMTSIPKETIEAILSGDNEEAKEAVQYFGLDKNAP